ncbi:tRNA:m(4)X modification enzyme TRM13 homolog [Alosa sapidissima]|uniref:tRNA:m(4)X modification enzyme TRM13 homolog n=1 Tax=Alosa sapidissima TaxID=34773 RepID=UPI001C08BF9D|nr:tRNA:m(4)X modification enzyme TRM13 homolog [Alosa sapidissima]
MESAVVADGVSAPLPGRCAYFVEKKKRYCKMVVGSGKAYCGEHANVDQESARKRIPCPLDPKHTVYEDILAKHLKKCNSKEKPKPVYYVKDINAGPVTVPVPVSDEVSLADRSQKEMEHLIQKLKNAVKGLSVKHKESILSHPVLKEPLNDPKNGDFACKHLKQQASILGNMEALSLLGSHRCVVEFGAGKGKLSHWIHTALGTAEDVHFLLVERSTTRFKVDGKNRSTDSTFERLQVDIQHLDLSKVSLLQEKHLPVVGVGKHLCGAATDLALRCLLERSVPGDDGDEPSSKRVRADIAREGSVAAPSQQPEVGGVAIALCCHHRCDWQHYVGQEFFRQRGLGAAEFGAFQRMSSWATCGMSRAGGHREGTAVASAGITEGTTEGTAGPDTAEEEEEEHEGGEETGPDHLDSLSVEEREHIGRLCKLLIDQGRVHYLQQRGLEAGLRSYTTPDISLENVLLTAVPRPGHTGAPLLI